MPSAVSGALGGSITQGGRSIVLPDNWRQATTDEGQIYFWNINTKQVTWEVPKLQPAEAVPPPPPPPPLPKRSSAVLSEKDMNELGKKFVNVSQLISWRPDAVKNLESELKAKGVKFQKPGSDKGKESAQSPNGKKRFREEEEDARGEPPEVRKSARGPSKTPARDDAQQRDDDEDDDVPLGDRVRKHTDTTRRKKQAAESRRSKKRNQEEEEDQEEQSPSKTKKKGSGERRETTSKDNDRVFCMILRMILCTDYLISGREARRIRDG